MTGFGSRVSSSVVKKLNFFIYHQNQYLSTWSDNSFNVMLIDGEAKATGRYILTVYFWKK